MCCPKPYEIIEYFRNGGYSDNDFWWDDFSKDELRQVADLIVNGKIGLLARKDGSGTVFFHHLFKNVKNYSIAEYILENVDVDVNMRDQYGNTPLHLVAANSSDPKNDSKNYEIAKLLLENGANLNIQNKYKDTPLHIAVRQCWYCENFFELLIRAKPNLCIKDADGKTVYDYIIDDNEYMLYLYISIKLKIELEDILKHSPVSKIEIKKCFLSEFFFKIYNNKNKVIYDLLLDLRYKDSFLELIKENLHKLDFKNDRFEGEYEDFKKFIKNKQ